MTQIFAPSETAHLGAKGWLDPLSVFEAKSRPAKWCRLAAEQGQAIGQYNLGVMYAKGEGVPKDFVLAHMWLNLAASQMPLAEFRDKARKARNVVELQMTQEQIAEAQRLAREWRPKPAAQKAKSLVGSRLDNP